MRYVQNANWESDFFFEDIICDQKPPSAILYPVWKYWDQELEFLKLRKN